MSLAPGLHAVPPGHVAAVVTHLQRTAPPQEPPPAPDGVGLVREMSLDVAAYREIFVTVGRDWLWQSRLCLDDTALQDVLRRPDLEIYRVTVDDATAGLLELDFRNGAWPELAFLGLAPGHTGRGIGKWLIAEAVARGLSNGAAGLTVHTCTLDSPRALAFYMAHGFDPIHRDVEIMVDPRVAGLLDPGAAPDVPTL